MYPAFNFPTVAPKLDTYKYHDTMVVRVGATFNLDVPFKATPKPTVKWTKDNSTLQASSRIKIDTTDRDTIVTIKNCVREDEGSFKLDVSNTAGSDAITIRVQVLDRPEQPRGPLAAKDIGSTDLFLSWKEPADDGGSPITHYIIERREEDRTSWTRLTTRALDTTVRVTSLQEGASYVFRVFAVNKIGDSEPLETKETIKLKKKYGKCCIDFAIFLENVIFYHILLNVHDYKLNVY